MQYDIVVTKIDEVDMHIDCCAGIAMELNDFFSFEVPGHRFMPKFKSGMWDGRIRLMNLGSRILRIGLLMRLLNFCEKWDYSIKLDEKLFPQGWDKKQFLEFFENLNVTGSDGNPITPKDYQMDAWKIASKFERATIISPTASGKSLMIYGACRWFEEVNDGMAKKILIIVPTISLVYQMAKDFADYSQANGWDWESKIHCISGGVEKENRDAKIYISTWQSLYRQPVEYFAKFGAVIGDECHQYKADEIGKCASNCKNAWLRLGFTGTLDGAKANELQIQGLFGEVMRVASTKELMDRGDVAGLKIKLLHLNYGQESRDIVAPLDFPNERKFLTKHIGRAKMVANLAMSQDKNVVVLYQNIKHGILMKEFAEKLNDGGKNVFLVDGGTKVEEREEVRRIMETQNNCVLFATYGVYSTGVNVKNLHVVVFAYPSKSIIRVLQSIGRGLRKMKGKSHMVLFDLVDMFYVGKKKTPKHCIKHGGDRIKIYEKSEFDYKFNEINLEERFGDFNGRKLS